MMNKFVICTLAALCAPLGVSVATIAVEGGGPYDIASDKLFTGIVVSSADGAGSYIVDFFTSGQTVTAVADTAVTPATINSSFTNLTLSWIDGLSLNSLISSAGVDQLTTVFDAGFPVQQLRFDWTDSADGAGFRFDVTTAAVPLPATALLAGTALAGLGFFGRRQRRTSGLTA